MSEDDEAFNSISDDTRNIVQIPASSHVGIPNNTAEYDCHSNGTFSWAYGNDTDPVLNVTQVCIST